MPATIFQSQKRILVDSTDVHKNANIMPQLNAAKRRKLDFNSSPAVKARIVNGPNTEPRSSQTKSLFEEEVLEKLTQDINGLKQKNSENDQSWDRPSLDDFDDRRENLCFQQIEAEEGSLHGGRTTVKLFGVTEVSSHYESYMGHHLTC